MSTTTVATAVIVSDNLVVMPRRPGITGFFEPFEPTPLEVDWAEQNLAGLDILVRTTTLQDEEGVVSIREASDGSWWRYPGSIRLRQHPDGAWRFTIYLYRGATTEDYRNLRAVIRRAQGGMFLRAGWRQRPMRDGGDAWVYDLGRPSPAPDQDFAYLPMFVTVCTDSRCQDDVHFGTDFEHVADETSGKRWSITVSRAVDPDEEEQEFQVYVEFEGCLHDREVADFANDLAWMQGACRKANAKTSDPCRKGWTTPNPHDMKQIAA